jgi:hypothetical protein
LYATGTHVELSHITVRSVLLIAALSLAAACRGEKPPRDYQNEPPAMTHPPKSVSQTPAAKGLPGPKPELSKDAEGPATKPVTPVPPPPKLKDQAPTTTTPPRK